MKRNEPQSHSLEQRVEELERIVAELRTQLDSQHREADASETVRQTVHQSDDSEATERGAAKSGGESTPADRTEESGYWETNAWQPPRPGSESTPTTSESKESQPSESDASASESVPAHEDEKPHPLRLAGTGRTATGAAPRPDRQARPGITQHVSKESSEPGGPSRPRTVESSVERNREQRSLLQSESGLKILGIILLLLGIGFLFKYSIDEGWLTEWVRVGFGVGAGLTLIGVGLRVGGKRSAFGQAFSGTGIAALYISGFAAFQLYELVPQTTAFVYMIAVTLSSFLLSFRHNTPALVLIGGIGGFATPFLLSTGSANITGLVVYSLFVMVGLAAIYAYKGWLAALWTGFIGMWAILVLGLENSAPAHYTALSLGSLATWLVLWLVPTVREHLRTRYAPTVADAGESNDTHIPAILPIILLSPLLAYVANLDLWPVSDTVLGWRAMAGFGIFAASSAILRYLKSDIRIYKAHVAPAIVSLSVGLGFLLSGNALMLAYTFEALALALFVRMIEGRMEKRMAHLLFAGLALWAGMRMANDSVAVFAVTSESWIFHLGVVVAFAVASFLWNEEVVRDAYRSVAFVLLALFFGAELDRNPALLACALEGVVVAVVARKWGSIWMQALSHFFFAGLTLWVVGRIVGSLDGVDPRGRYDWPIDLLVIGALAGVSFLKDSRQIRFLYRVVPYALLLMLFYRELYELDGGQGMVSIAWGVCGIVWLIVGLRRHAKSEVTVGLATLLLVVAKLFFIDLASLNAIWRILLFIGFGVLFLAVSYFVRSFWGSDEAAETHSGSLNEPGGTERTDRAHEPDNR